MLAVILTVSFLFFGALANNAQTPFDLMLEPMSVPGLGGLQSYAFGQDNGKWLIIGGRLDGLHQRQPFASFDIAGHNNQLFVVDPVGLQSWTAPLSSLPVAMQEQLSATNPEFLQEGKYLYIFGGYGYSATIGDHKTFDNLTAVDVGAVIDAIINGTAFASFFRQISDPQFTVTGGRVEKIYDTWYLFGGQRFDGRYNPMGPEHGPGFFQEYTEQIRKFTLHDDGTSMTINHLPAITDAANFHRRDLNVPPQIMPNGEEGMTVFSGVFQHDADLPFLNAINIDSSGYYVNNSFTQYYNHYHCPTLPVYSAVDNEMHTVFFGGIAQFYEENGSLIQDDNVPFVNTIARITRKPTGEMIEKKLAIEMPGLMGAGGEFIPVKSLPRYHNGVLKLDSLSADTVLVGYIFGGINSTDRNIFFVNDGTQSSAYSEILKVHLIRCKNYLLIENKTYATDKTLFARDSVALENVIVTPPAELNIITRKVKIAPESEVIQGATLNTILENGCIENN